MWTYANSICFLLPYSVSVLASLSVQFHSFYCFFHSLSSNQQQKSHQRYCVSCVHVHLPAFGSDLPVRCTDLYLTTCVTPHHLQWGTVPWHQHLLLQMGLQREFARGSACYCQLHCCWILPWYSHGTRPCSRSCFPVLDEVFIIPLPWLEPETVAYCCVPLYN